MIYRGNIRTPTLQDTLYLTGQQRKQRHDAVHHVLTDILYIYYIFKILLKERRDFFKQFLWVGTSWQMFLITATRKSRCVRHAACDSRCELWCQTSLMSADMFYSSSVQIRAADLKPAQRLDSQSTSGQKFVDSYRLCVKIRMWTDNHHWWHPLIQIWSLLAPKTKNAKVEVSKISLSSTSCRLKWSRMIL